MRYRLITVAALLILASGCVERTMKICSEPEGAHVWVNSRYVGKTPVDRLDFTHYGEYEITMRHEGYRTRTAVEKVSAPWYERFPVDLLAESLVPWRASDAREFDYVLEKAGLRPAKEVVADALEARRRLKVAEMKAGGPPERSTKVQGK